MRGCAAHGFFPLSQGLRISAVSLAGLREFSPFREDCGELQHCLHSIASVLPPFPTVARLADWDEDLVDSS